MKIKSLVLSALFVAIYFVLNLIVIIKMPQGGSASLCSTLFLVLPGFMFGPIYGIAATVSAGMISFISSPWFLSPIQFLLDYVFAYMAWCFGSFFISRKSKYSIEKYYLIGLLFSFIFGTLSGIVFFGSYAPEGMNPIVYSVLYNAGYRIAEAILVFIVLRISAFRVLLYSETNKLNS